MHYARATMIALIVSSMFALPACSPKSRTVPSEHPPVLWEDLSPSVPPAPVQDPAADSTNLNPSTLEHGFRMLGVG